jgi:hypothetical protein
MTQALTLYTIETRLSELLQLRELAEEEGEMPESLKVIDDQIDLWMRAEIKKVDGIAHAIRSYKSAAEEAAKEAERLRLRADRLAATADRIRACALAAMQAHGVTKVETPANILRIQKNGGLAPLVIDDPAKISPGLKVTNLKVNGEALAILKLLSAEFKTRDCGLSNAISAAERTLEPDGPRIRAAITEGEEVSGVQLGERQSHLRLE